MKSSITMLLLLSALISTAQDGKASTIKKTFSRTTAVSISINADPAIIWDLLTDAKSYPEWNSTVISIEGEIRKGEKIRLKSTLDPKRTFKLKVKEMAANQKMVWGDAMGKRVYTLETKGGKTLFSMTEKIGGLLFPLFAKKIPPFDQAFEQFAADLKKTAESNG